MAYDSSKLAGICVVKGYIKIWKVLDRNHLKVARTVNLMYEDRHASLN